MESILTGKLIEAIVAQYGLPLSGTHGITHWARVYENGLLLARRAESAAYVSFDRARPGATGVGAVMPPQPFPALVDAVAERLQADLQRISDGAPLPALGVEAVCRHCEARGLCRRDYWEHADGSGTDEERG
jgi:hypothetical protein